jgi:hypothetical protein
MDSGFQDDAREWDLERESEALSQLLIDHARACTRRHGLPADSASDIAQEAFVLLWEVARSGREKPTRAKVLAFVEQVASAERQKRRRKRARLARGVPSPPPSIRPICARLSLLEPFAESPREYRAALHAAAVLVAHSKGVLRASQLRLFGLVHAMGQDHDAIRVRLESTMTKKALQKRIRRLARRIERHVLARLEAEMPAPDWDRIAALVLGPGSTGHRIKKAASPDLRRLCRAVLLALGQVIHRDPGPRMS